LKKENIISFVFIEGKPGRIIIGAEMTEF